MLFLKARIVILCSKGFETMDLSESVILVCIRGLSSLTPT